MISIETREEVKLKAEALIEGFEKLRSLYLSEFNNLVSDAKKKLEESIKKIEDEFSVEIESLKKIDIEIQKKNHEAQLRLDFKNALKRNEEGLLSPAYTKSEIDGLVERIMPKVIFNSEL